MTKYVTHVAGLVFGALVLHAMNRQSPAHKSRAAFRKWNWHELALSIEELADIQGENRGRTEARTRIREKIEEVFRA